MSQEPILLFYDGTERPARDGALGALLSQSRRAARFTYRTAMRKQVRTGFYTAFLALDKALRTAGAHVRVNDFEFARKNPHLPIGVGGYSSVVDRVSGLPNKRIFGPGDFGGPPEARSVADDARYVVLTQPSEWFAELYRPYVGDKIAPWFVGIDTDRYVPDPNAVKDIDVLIYDKIRWNHDVYEAGLLRQIDDLMKRLSLRSATVRYGHHHQSEFHGLARRSKAMLFLCEHETQGLAYQEAMSLNVPVLAWDEGVLVDPYLSQFVTPDIKVTSVPYFDARCGSRFQLANFETAFIDFWKTASAYAPRAYVCEELSLARSAALYLGHYDKARS
jgi:glycosyltransferase involved in cell wall biosynthesis